MVQVFAGAIDTDVGKLWLWNSIDIGVGIG